MIEIIVLEFLKKELNENVYLEKPKVSEGSYVLFEKTSSGKENHMPTATIAFQSYGKSMYEAAELNDRVKKSVERMIELDEIRGLTLNGDYNFTNTTTKEYRYQAVYDIRYY